MAAWGVAGHPGPPSAPSSLHLLEVLPRERGPARDAQRAGQAPVGVRFGPRNGGFKAVLWGSGAVRGDWRGRQQEWGVARAQPGSCQFRQVVCQFLQFCHFQQEGGAGWRASCRLARPASPRPHPNPLPAGEGARREGTCGGRRALWTRTLSQSPPEGRASRDSPLREGGGRYLRETWQEARPRFSRYCWW